MWNALADIGDTEITLQKTDLFKKINKVQKNATTPRVNTDLFSKLPENFVFNILSKVPATYLHENARLACKAWEHLFSSTSFIAQNALETKPMLLLQWSNNKKCLFMKRKIMEVEEKRLSYKLHDFEPGLIKWDLIRSSCNGLILVSPPKKCEYYCLHVMNLATKNYVSLPPPCSFCDGGLALGFDAKTNKYKVVHICDEFGLVIYTLGDYDSNWRQVSIPWKKQRPSSLENCWGDPVVINGRFLFWNLNSDEYIVSMDLSTKKLVKIRIPYFDEKNYTLIELDGHISLVRNVSDTHIDIWVLQNVHGLTWFRKHSISAKSTKYSVSENSSSCRQKENNFPDLSKIVPIGCARRGEVLIFKYMRSGTDFRMYLYDVVHREMKKFKMTNRNLQPLIAHRSTLVHWNT